MEYLVGSATLWMAFSVFYGLPIFLAGIAAVMIYRRWRTRGRL